MASVRALCSMNCVMGAVNCAIWCVCGELTDVKVNRICRLLASFAKDRSIFHVYREIAQ